MRYGDESLGIAEFVKKRIEAEVDMRIRLWFQESKGEDWTKRFEEACAENYQLKEENEGLRAELAEIAEECEKAKAQAMEWAKERDLLLQQMESIKEAILTALKSKLK